MLCMSRGKPQGNPSAEEYRSQKNTTNGYSSSLYANDDDYGSYPSLDMDTVKKKESKKEENKSGGNKARVLPDAIARYEREKRAKVKIQQLERRARHSPTERTLILLTART
jgi:hypothetical protein